MQQISQVVAQRGLAVTISPGDAQVQGGFGPRYGLLERAVRTISPREVVECRHPGPNVFEGLRELDAALQVLLGSVQVTPAAGKYSKRVMDLGAALAFFADDAVLIDPHYPVPRMVGKSTIADGLRWSFGQMKTFGFTVENYFESEDGKSAALEVETAHVLNAGMRLNFPQVFVVEVRDGLLTRVRAYEPYGPGGVGGIVLGLTRLWRRVSKKR